MISINFKSIMGSKMHPCVYISACVASIDSYDGFFAYTYFDPLFHLMFRPENVLKNECDNYRAQNYWLLYGGVANAGFVIDRNCREPFNKVILKNTHNGMYNDRLFSFYVTDAQEYSLIEVNPQTPEEQRASRFKFSPRTEFG